MQTINRQAGMTLIGWLLTLLLVLVVLIVLIKLVPVYLDGYKVYQSLESLKEDSNARGANSAKLRQMLMKRLDINMVSDVTADDVSINREGKSTTVEVEYEARRQIFGNLYAVIVFSKSVEISGN